MSFWYLIKISTQLSKLSHSPQFPLQGLDVLLAVEYRTLQTGDFLLVNMTAFSYAGLRQRFLRFAQCFTLIAQLCFQNRTAASAAGRLGRRRCSNFRSRTNGRRRGICLSGIFRGGFCVTGSFRRSFSSRFRHFKSRSVVARAAVFAYGR